MALIGGYNITDPTEDSEMHVFQEVVLHPHYYEPIPSDDFDETHDYALIKIFDTSKVGPPIKLNKDPTVPDSTPDVPLRVLGWGNTNASDYYSSSDILKEADVNFIPNDVCKQVKVVYNGYAYSLERKVFDISLCAADFEEREDTCQGDSGGPILLAGEDANDDLQLGITSSGLGCAHPQVPAIYARVSYVYDWIREHVCRMSLDPPADFDCEPPTASTEPDLSGEMVNLTLEFSADIFANEAGWIVQSPNENGVMVTYAYQSIGMYPTGTDESDIFNLNVTFSIPSNRYYVLTIFDSFGDGFSNGTQPFPLKLSTDDETILDESLTFANYSIAFDFVLGSLPTASPTVTPAPTATMPPSMAPTVTPPILWIVIQFDVRPEETGWRIQALRDNGETEKLHEVYPGTYINLTSIREPFRLLSETPMKYRFTLTDNEANGICCDFGIGFYQLWLGEPGAGMMLVRGQDFVWEISHEFVVNGTSNEYTGTAITETSSAAQFGSILAALLSAFTVMISLV